MKKLLFMYLVLIFHHLPGQNVIRPADWHNLGKIYLDKSIEVPAYYDDWGVPSPQTRIIHIQLIGPENITAGKEGTFYLDFFPNNSWQRISSAEAECINNFNFSIITSEGFLEFYSQPQYRVRVDDLQEFQTLTDISEFSRNAYLYSAGVLKAVFGMIPVVGQTLALGEVVAGHMKLRNIQEPDWVNIWHLTFTHDYYPILGPVHVKLEDYKSIYLAREFRIVLPFKAHSSRGELSLKLHQVGFSSVSDYMRPTYVYDQVFEIFKTGYNYEPTPVQVKSPGKETRYYTQALDPDVNIEIATEIKSETNRDYLLISILPKINVANKKITLNNLDMAVILDKGFGMPVNLPIVSEMDGNPADFETLRSKSKSELTEDWAMFALSVASLALNYQGFHKGATILDGVNAGLDLSRFYSENLTDLSFSQSIDKLWSSQNRFNSFTFPTIIPRYPAEGLSNLLLKIPMQFYSYIETNNINIVIQADLSIEQTSAVPYGSSIITNDEIRIDYSYPNQTNERENKPFIALILDSSGSMTETDPNDIRKSASKGIIDILKGYESLFLIDFDNDAKWLNSSEWSRWDPNRLKAYVDQINSDGGTNIGSGLNILKNILTQTNQLDNRGIVILLTDGKSDFNEESAWFRHHEIPVNCVSYKDFANARLLNHISSSTNGTYIQANDEREIIEAFLQFYNNLFNYNTIFSEHGYFFAGNPEKSFNFYVEPGTSDLFMMMSWVKRGGSCDLILSDPAGNIYRPQESSLSENYRYVRIDNPSEGRWYLNVKYRGSMDTNLPYTVEVGSDAPRHLKLINTEISENNVTFRLIDQGANFNLSQINPVIKVTKPDRSEQNISNQYYGGVFSYKPELGMGTYTFNVIVDQFLEGKNIIRHLTASVFYGSDKDITEFQVVHVSGNTIKINAGKFHGIKPGMKCMVVSEQNIGSVKIPDATVTYVTNLESFIEITATSSRYIPQKGDIVKFDPVSWRGDK